MAVFQCDYCRKLIPDDKITGVCPQCTETKFTEQDCSYNLFTDGGAWPNPGNGAFAFILKRRSDGQLISRQCGYRKTTTNNRMELTAVIEGIKSTPEGSYVHIVSDSQYVVKGLMEWRHNWKKKNWSGVLNSDLWKTLDDLADTHDIDAEWIRGHNGHPENEECDSMALVCRELNDKKA